VCNAFTVGYEMTSDATQGQRTRKKQLAKELEITHVHEVMSGSVHVERPLDGTKSMQKYVFIALLNSVF